MILIHYVLYLLIKLLEASRSNQRASAANAEKFYPGGGNTGPPNVTFIDGSNNIGNNMPPVSGIGNFSGQQAMMNGVGCYGSGSNNNDPFGPNSGGPPFMMMQQPSGGSNGGGQRCFMMQQNNGMNGSGRFCAPNRPAGPTLVHNFYFTCISIFNFYLYDKTLLCTVVILNDCLLMSLHIQII